MPTKLTLIHRPRSPRRLHTIIRNEVRAAYRKLADEMIRRLEKDIEDWSHQPTFLKHVEAGRQRWLLSIRYDADSPAGKIYTYVDRGTGAAAGGETYPIVPKHADVLKFTVPDIPKTTVPISGIGVPGVVISSGITEQETVFTKRVEHPGITPRNFTKSLREWYSQRDRPGAFRSVTEAAVKRGSRKIGKAAVGAI